MLKLTIAGVLASSFLLLVSVTFSGCFDGARTPAHAMVVPYPPPMREEIPKPIVVPPRPEMPVHVIPMRVTACSPDDPKDRAYYKAHGYEGGVYGIAANLKRFPRGTFMRIPGYLQKSYPDRWWEVDSAGGSVIRRSARMGVTHIDVKLRHYNSAMKWGSQNLKVEVVYASEYKAWQQAAAAWDHQYGQVLLASAR